MNMDVGHNFLFLVLLSAAATGWCSSVEELANSLQVSFALNENYAPEIYRFTASLSLRNIGTETIRNGTWNIYFCSVRVVAPDDLIGDNVAPKPEGAKLGNSGFTVFHIAGCLFRLQPNGDFQDIASGNERVINYVGEFWVVARSDVMPNFYVATPDGKSAPIRNTMDEMINFAAPLTLPRQYKRIEEDQFAPYTPQQRYNRYVANDQGQSPSRIIPQPVLMYIASELTVHIDSSWVVYGNAEESLGASYLAERLGISVSTSSQETNVIELNIDKDFSTEQTCSSIAEAYVLNVWANRVVITAAQHKGVVHGIQTLLALLSEDSWIGLGYVKDCPRFSYRGFMIDVGRHFLPVEEIIRTLDAMAMYKLNKFHFHLSEDEGFRVEIPALPELTTVGATQCHDVTGDECIMPQLGSPPNKKSGGSGSGYYTVEEYRRILSHAAKLEIQVIPEIDMPGHAHAIIKAMESRYRNLQDPTYILWDPKDTTKYLSVQYFTDNAINPCISSTYTFVETILDAFIELHRGIQDLEIFHWGGDEVPGAWLDSPACHDLALNEPSLPLNPSVRQLKGYFFSRIQRMMHLRGLASGAWEDGVLSHEGDPIEIPDGDTAYSYAWSNVWEWGHGGLAYAFANSGYQSVISHSTHTYFDHPVEPDPEDRGYYWAPRFIDAYKTFSFVASDIYKNIDIDRFGQKLDPEKICADYACPKLQKPENLVGIQGQAWLETMRTTEQFQGMVYPRLLALAERAWHQSDWESINDTTARAGATQQDWQGFANRVGYRELQRLDALGIKYDVRPPAVLVDGNNLRIKTEFPGQQVELSTDSGLTWSQYYPGMPVPNTDAIFVTKSADGSRRSRPVKFAAPDQHLIKKPRGRQSKLTRPTGPVHPPRASRPKKNPGPSPSGHKKHPPK